MAALANTVLAANIAAAQDIEMIRNFNGEMDRLAEILGIFGPEVVAAGTTMYTYKVTGSLNATAVAEGDEVPLSSYTVTKTPVGSITVKPYRKLTTAQAILKGGYENAVAKTDRKMVSQVRKNIISDFFTFLATGTGTATGASLQAALAQADAKLADAMETNGDEADSIIHFVNPFDVAGHLGDAAVTMQTVFGMKYLQSFLGVEDVFVTNKVAKGTVYVTPAENIHIYGVDFGALGDAGLEYTTQDGSLIGVHHAPTYNRTSAETYVLAGAFMLAEMLDYVVKATIAAAENGEAGGGTVQKSMAMALDMGADEGDVEGGEPDGAADPQAVDIAELDADSTISEIREYADASGIELPKKATKAELLAAVKGE